MKLTAAALLLSVLLYAAPVAAADDAPPAAAPEAESTAVKLEPLETRLTVEVMVNGAGPFRFFVDSGASHSVVSRELAAMLALPAAGRARLLTVGGVTPVQTARIDHLEVGGMTVKPVTAPVLAQANIRAAGILGIDALAGKQIEMDLVTNEMTIRRSGGTRAPASDPREIVVTARRRSGQLILVDADIEGQQIYAILDTGTDTTIGNLALEQRLSRDRGFTPAGVQLHDVAGRATVADVALIPTMRIGGMNVMSISAAFTDAHPFTAFGVQKRPAMLLGMDLLRSFRRVIIDFGSRKVRFLLD